MKTHNVINLNGLLFSKESNKRIILKEKHEFVITSTEDGFEEVDSLNKEPERLRDSNEMKSYVYSKYPNHDIMKLFDAGNEFIFRIGLGKRKDNEEEKDYFFICRILEDLYLYRKSIKSFPRLFECHSVVHTCVSRNLPAFEEVYGESLNKVASNTIMHFFSLKRSSSMNIFNEFRMFDKV
jgi:hypothetical protein